MPRFLADVTVSLFFEAEDIDEAYDKATKLEPGLKYATEELTANPTVFYSVEEYD